MNEPHHPRCPTCKNLLSEIDPHVNRSFPFCDVRCKQIDLGRWLDGSFVVPGRTIFGLEEDVDVPGDMI